MHTDHRLTWPLSSHDAGKPSCIHNGYLAGSPETETDGEMTRAQRTCKTAPPSKIQICCVLNFASVPNLFELQRRMEKARADAFTEMGCCDLEILTRITRDAKKYPEEWYIKGWDAEDQFDSIDTDEPNTQGTDTSGSAPGSRQAWHGEDDGPDGASDGNSQAREGSGDAARSAGTGRAGSALGRRFRFPRWRNGASQDAQGRYEAGIDRAEHMRQGVDARSHRARRFASWMRGLMQRRSRSVAPDDS